MSDESSSSARYALLSIPLLFTIIGTISIALQRWTPGSVKGEWEWLYRKAALGRISWYFIVAALTAFIVYCLIFVWLGSGHRSVWMERLALLAACAAFLVIQLSSFNLEARGGERWLGFIASEHGYSYFWSSIKTSDEADILQNFPGNDTQLVHHAGVHPPGPTLFYFLTKESVYSNPSVQKAGEVLVDAMKADPENVAANNSLLASPSLRGAGALASMLLMLLSSLAVWFLFRLGQRLSDRRIAAFAAIVFVLTPSVILFVPSLDVITPALALAVVWLFVAGLRDAKPMMAVAAGVVLGFGMFMTLALAVAAVFLILFTLIDRTTPRQRRFGMLFITASGALAFLAIVQAVTGYDIISGTMTVMRRQQEFNTVWPRTYSKWVLPNLEDYVAFAGLGISALFLTATAFSKTPMKYFNLALLATILLIDVSGVGRGEVGRMWVFLMPFMGISAVSFIGEMLPKTRRFRQYSSVLTLLLMIQMVVYRGNIGAM